jgi:hypothetical protein
MTSSTKLTTALIDAAMGRSHADIVIRGAVLLFPMAYYLNGSPSPHGFAILPPFF